MGALHDGHLALIRAARGGRPTVVVTIFVNPLQFAPDEDLARYPRTLEADLELCAGRGATSCSRRRSRRCTRTASRWCGSRRDRWARCSRARPARALRRGAHRRPKLLQLTAPDCAFFGEKDAQQLALIRRMVADLDLPVEIVGVPTVREPDGLALLQPQPLPVRRGPGERRRARRALFAGAARRDARGDRAAARAVLDEAAGAEPPVEPDYLVLVDSRRLRRGRRRAPRPGRAGRGGAGRRDPADRQHAAEHRGTVMTDMAGTFGDPARRSRLLAPEPGWTAYADVVVVGSGIAGLTAALAARHAGSRAAGHQGHARRTAPPAGRRAASPPRSAAATPPTSTWPTRSSRASGCATRRPCACW